MDLGGGVRKRGRPEAPFNGNGNGGVKKSRPETESFTTGLGSKSKPCTKFFSTSGCSFGEACHFLHFVPRGLNAASQMINIGTSPSLPQAKRNTTFPPSFTDGSSPRAVKTRICNKYNTDKGCKFGSKCHFAHGEWELGKPTGPSYEDPRSLGQMQSRVRGQVEPPPPAHGAATTFGASSTAKISIDASLVGAIIGENDVNFEQICHVTGAKLSIRDHDSDRGLKNIELEGSFDQIEQSSAMVHELIVNVGSVSGPPPKSIAPDGPASASNFKTKLCENFAKGSCTFGERCHFAHGAEELCKVGM